MKEARSLDNPIFNNILAQKVVHQPSAVINRRKNVSSYEAKTRFMKMSVEGFNLPAGKKYLYQMSFYF
jgi:hypothetical protein